MFTLKQTAGAAITSRTQLVTAVGLVFASAVSFGTPARAGEAETQAILSCSQGATDPSAFAVCVGSVLTTNEAMKCFNSGFKDCYGPNNTIRKTVENTIVGPLKDITSGTIGGSTESTWRKIGLPRLRLW